MVASLLAPVVAPVAESTCGFERVMAILALVNLLLVIGDLTYIRFRDQYLRILPEVTPNGTGKLTRALEPHPETTAYLATVNDLQAQVAQTGLQSPRGPAHSGGFAGAKHHHGEYQPLSVGEQIGHLRAH